MKRARVVLILFAVSCMMAGAFVVSSGHNVASAYPGYPTQPLSGPTPSYVTPTLSTTWVASGSQTVGYYKDVLGYVHLQGSITGGEPGVIFTLPGGYRPAGTVTSPSLSSTLQGHMVGYLNTTVSSPWAGFGNAASWQTGSFFGGILVRSPYLTPTNVTIEAKIKPTAVNVAQAVAAMGVSGFELPYGITINSTGHVVGFAQDDFTGTITLTSTGTLTAGTTNDVALTYDGQFTRLWINGTKDGENNEGSSGHHLAYPFVNMPKLLIGGLLSNYQDAVIQPFGGVMDEVRVSNIARYSINYTPATSPFTPDANTLLLMHLDDSMTATGPNDTIVTVSSNGDVTLTTGGIAFDSGPNSIVPLDGITFLSTQ